MRLNPSLEDRQGVSFARLMALHASVMSGQDVKVADYLVDYVKPWQETIRNDDLIAEKWRQFVAANKKEI